MSERKKILIVDDMVSMRMLVSMLLKYEDFELDEAPDGQVALEKCQGDSPPDLVLLDVMMPKLSGVECCQLLKSSEKTKDIPVIIVTTRGEESQKEEAFAAGCDDYSTKPINKQELVKKIRRLLARRP